jgi:iron-sulfur cluster assembly protein
MQQDKSSAFLTLTPAAVDQIRMSLSGKNPAPLGIRITLRTKGCSGLAYSMAFAYDEQPFEEKVTQDGVSVFIDPKATLYLLGTEIDFLTTTLESGFQFINPNEKGKCGCGKSFHV